jgi:hypothetical protein
MNESVATLDAPVEPKVEVISPKQLKANIIEAVGHLAGEIVDAKHLYLNRWRINWRKHQSTTLSGLVFSPIVRSSFVIANETGTKVEIKNV